MSVSFFLIIMKIRNDCDFAKDRNSWHAQSSIQFFFNIKNVKKKVEYVMSLAFWWNHGFLL